MFLILINFFSLRLIFIFEKIFQLLVSFKLYFYNFNQLNFLNAMNVKMKMLLNFLYFQLKQDFIPFAHNNDYL